MSVHPVQTARVKRRRAVLEESSCWPRMYPADSADEHPEDMMQGTSSG